MKKFNQLVAIFLFLLFLNSCSTVSEGLAGSKKKSSDEFLVEKKKPLVLPPSFGELPEPGIRIDENLASTKKDTSSIKDLIDQSSSTDTNQENNDLNNSIEESIIKKIKKKKIKKLNVVKVVEEKKIPKKKGFFNKLKAKFSKLEH
tara:strand:- start:33 stop:470 length:438 start_codon:yes stop_codon:yes gene_type:complete